MERADISEQQDMAAVLLASLDDNLDRLQETIEKTIADIEKIAVRKCSHFELHLKLNVQNI